MSADGLAGVLAEVLAAVPAGVPNDGSHCDDVAAKPVVPCCQVFDADDDDNDNDFVDFQFYGREKNSKLMRCKQSINK